MNPRRRRLLFAASGLAAVALAADPSLFAQEDSDPVVTETRTVLQPQAAPPTPQSPAQSPAQGVASTVSPKDRREAQKVFTDAAHALDRGDLHQAEAGFAQAMKLDPSNPRYTAAHEIARQHLVTSLVQQAARARVAQNTDEEKKLLAQAGALDPQNPLVTQHAGDFALAAAPAPRFVYSDDPDEENLASPIALAPTSVRKDFHLRTTAPDLIRQVLSAYGITPSIDDSVRQTQARFEVQDVNFAQAASTLRLVTNTFFVPLDPHRVLVARDTKENRDKYQRLTYETVYLPGLTTTEMTDVGNIARNVFEITGANVQANMGTLTVRAPEPRLHAFNAILEQLVDGHAQIQLQVRIYEIDKTRTRNIGVNLPQQSTIFNVPSELRSVIQQNQDLVNQIISSGLASPGDYATIAALLLASGQVSSSILTSPFALFGGGLTLTGLTLGQGATVNLALNSSDARALDDLQLRVSDQETATVRSGTRYPIVTSTYSINSGNLPNIPGLNQSAASGVLASLGLSSQALAQQSQSIPQVQYEDLGLTVKVTPRIQRDQDVSLKLELKVQALGGSSVNGNPILNNREFSAVVTLRAGDSALIVSALSKQESGAVSGIPGISEIPGLQSTTDKSSEYDVSDLVIVITPQIVRNSHPTSVGRLISLPTHD